MVHQARNPTSHELHEIELFYPAPHGLPVPVKPNRGSTEVFQQIRSFDWNSLGGGGKNADLLQAGAFWLHGFLPESHFIAQGNPTVEGSYWHALMHRSESDFSNSMYWFRKVGKHAVFPGLFNQVKSLRPSSSERPNPLKEIGESLEWQPQWFVDLCELAYRGQFNDLNLLREIAVFEYNLLMKYCLDLQVG